MGAQDTAERLRAINAELSGLFYERDDVIRTLTVAIAVASTRSCWGLRR